MTSEERRMYRSTEYIKEAALNWVLSGTRSYVDFFEMLMLETADRWLISHYLAVKFADDKPQAAWELAWFLRHTLDHRQGDFDMYDVYVQDTRALLDIVQHDDELIKEVFEMYDRLKALPKDVDVSTIIGEDAPEYLQAFG